MTRKLLPPPMPDRPGRWRMLWRRQRRMLRPAVLLGAGMVMCVGVVVVASVVGRADTLRTLMGRATADLGLRVQHITFADPQPQKVTLAALRHALGVTEGDAALGFSVSEARKRIEALTWVQSATVERRLPDEVRVSVVERSAFAVWQNQGKFVLIDRAGDVVADQDVAVLGKDLPLVVGVGAPAAAASLIAALKDHAPLFSRVVASVRVGGRRWNLRLNNGTDVMLPEGAEVQAMDKLVALQNEHAVLDRPMQALDLRLPDRLVARPRPEPAATTPPQPARKPT